MSARKLGRLAGLVIVFVALFGGAGAAHADASPENAGAVTKLSVEWG